MQIARRVVVGRRAADEREQIERIGEETFDREAARDILQVRIETAIFMDDDDDWALALGLRARAR